MFAKVESKIHQGDKCGYLYQRAYHAYKGLSGINPENANCYSNSQFKLLPVAVKAIEVLRA